MRLTKFTLAFCAAALGVTLLSSNATANWGGHNDKAVTFSQVMKDPAKLKGERIVFKMYFNSIADNYNKFYTEFHQQGHMNFGAWPMDARLYTKRDFQRCYPHFYAPRRSEVMKDIQELDRFDVIEIVGIVKHIYEGRPYIEVLEIDEVSDGMSESEIRAAIKGHAYFLAGKYERASSLLRSATTSDVSATIEADLYRRLGDAEFGDKDYVAAKRAYDRALKKAPDSKILKGNISACIQAYKRGRKDQQAQIQPTKYIAHHLEPVRPDMSCGVDLIIAALEDPTAVAEADSAERMAMAKRSVHGTKGLKTVVVKETMSAEPVEVVAAEEEPKEATEKVAAAGSEDAPADQTNAHDSAAEEKVVVEEVPASEVEKVVAEEVVAEETPKAQEPKADEPVTDAPKVDEAEAEEPMPEETTAEEAKPEEAKNEEPEAAPESVEDAPEMKKMPTAETPKVDMPTPSAPVAVIPAAVAPKVDAPEIDAPEIDAPEAVVPESDVPDTEAPQADGEDSIIEMSDDPEEDAQDEDDPRVLKVGNTFHILPRMPFSGCSQVNYDQFKAVVEEIMETEDDLEIDGMTVEPTAEEMPAAPVAEEPVAPAAEESDAEVTEQPTDAPDEDELDESEKATEDAPTEAPEAEGDN